MKRNEIKLAREKPVIFRELVREIPSTTYATFALYRYPAKFIPQVIAYALKTYASPGMSVFDPFAGYGTVGTVARIYGNHYELWDLNPLLEYLHAIAIMKPVQFFDVGVLIRRMAAHKNCFSPDWPNVTYWFPEQFLPMLSKAWDFYRSLDDEMAKRILLIPLMKATRYFSYNDERRQKLSRSSIANKRVDSLLAGNWKDIFFKMLLDGACNILNRIHQYWGAGPKPVKAIVRAGVDTFFLELENQHDLLITSPPYLQAQEYIRASKIDLFWLGYSEAIIKQLAKKEIPYRDIPSCPIYSPTYREYHEQITEAHLRRLFERYFYGVLGALTRLQRKISHRLLLFVGPATIRGKAIPIDRIFAEHFVELGWRHEITFIDSIVARSMFFYRRNPATNMRDKRMSTEHLVILSRR